ncbi:MAG: 4-(cytidine 5'-diphospho)-2-C-methyl-D-erythritol kinase [Clostridium sp.]|nr:4-(cytidine 5'-diphospho)-2-C-methyl-D-erythritol kinase [Clostridium sp.]
MLLFPNAKINLGLNITSRRADGYHDIETVMVPVGWTDLLEITPSASGETTLTVSGRGVACPMEKNLVIKALRAFERATGRPARVDISLHKVIPDGAGLGGGSSDAASTIVALNRLTGAGFSDDELASIASEVGADCPFFIYNRPMLATGTGTDLAPIDLSLAGMLVAIVKPEGSVSTAQAYAGVTPGLRRPTVAEVVAMSPAKWQELLFNDFEESVFPSCPDSARVKLELLRMNPVYASMSGSGSSVYALFDGTRSALQELTDELRGRFPGMELHVSRFE